MYVAFVVTHTTNTQILQPEGHFQHRLTSLSCCPRFIAVSMNNGLVKRFPLSFAAARSDATSQVEFSLNLIFFHVSEKTNAFYCIVRCALRAPDTSKYDISRNSLHTRGWVSRFGWARASSTWSDDAESGRQQPLNLPRGDKTKKESVNIIFYAF